MKTSDFDFHLPPDRIAQYPAARRDESRLMVLHRQTGQIEHRVFRDLPAYLRPADLLVLNNTRVIPARLHGVKQGTGGRVEVFLLEEVAAGLWDVLLRSRRRPTPGQIVILAGGEITATMVEDGELGRARVRLEADRPIIQIAEEHGETPLPPYIHRAKPSHEPSSAAPSVSDRERYQTIYARAHGAVAAPTAGLHFTPEVFAELDRIGVRRAEVTLHVGLGTFRPVSVELIQEHRMEGERYEITEEAARQIARTKAAGGRVVAVGSTVVRTLEHAAARHGRIKADAGRSDLFIHPPFAFQVVDAMLTNFHLPKSTLLMMVSALAGRDVILAAYAEAIREGYRFFSYGDCMLIL